MRELFLFSLLAGILNFIAMADDTLRVYNNLTVHDLCPNVTKLVMVLPHPESNQYQEVIGHRFSPYGEVKHTSLNQPYLRFLYYPEQLSDLSEFTVSDTFDIVFKEISVPFYSIDPDAQYDTQSDDYIKNIGNRGIFIQPQHPYIDSIANAVWETSDHSIIDYAYKCYEYVAQHLTYHLYLEGLLPLDTVIARQGGECGDFTTLYVNMLRNKNIPARHVAAFTGDNQFHVWAEFLLPGYGWVPVDATYKNGDPLGNYFGEYHEHYIVSHYSVNLSINCGDGFPTGTLLQSFMWWYWASPEICPAMDANRTVWNEPSQGPLLPMGITSIQQTKLFDITVHSQQIDILAPGSLHTDVFDISGRLITRLRGEHGTIHLNSSGVYIIKPESYPARKVFVP